ncbi:MAG: adenylosuccinate synthetase [Caldilinea sp. CFX5]|nr:adenylosuccinate synthetase [Caldilinea sp. CFX5]
MKRQAFLTVDLGFGDAGKGSIVDFLTRTYEAHTVIRYNGGAQAGHRVVATAGDGVTRQAHVFAQFGAGTLAGAATHLSRFMLLDPLAMLAEEVHLRTLGISDAFQRTTIDREAVVITPFQRAVNRVREALRGAGRHGSCGMGIGETAADRLAYGDRVLLAGDLVDRDRLYTKLAFLRTVNLAKVEPLRDQIAACEQAAPEMAWLLDSAWDEWLLDVYDEFARQVQLVSGAYLSTVLAQPGTVVFEGAQGVLLDEWVGFHPHTTWSTTTLANADQLLTEADYTGQVTRVGITRAYATRHGAGPFVTEDAALTAALPDACNSTGAWQQGFRVGWLDLVMLRYALAVAGPLDYLAVTCLDRLAALAEVKLCTHYQEDAGCLAAITPSPRCHDLLYQERLTQHLKHCRPHLLTLPDSNALMAAVTTALSVPVGLLSYGPTAAEKQLST